MKISVLTLGCKVNKYESDALIFELRKRGHDACDRLEKADAYIINTCAVTNEAESKSRQMIQRARKFNPNAHFFVVGCASQNRPQQFQGRGVCAVLGAAGKLKILDEIEKISKQDQAQENSNSSQNIQWQNAFDLPAQYEDDLYSAQTLARAFVKIQDGCNRFCTYCLIPYLRGRSRSRSEQSIVAEVEKLPSSVKEIVLVGIDVSDYRDQNGQKALGSLLQRLDGFGKRLRLSSMEDSLIDEQFLQQLAALKNFCPHFHLSLQSGSNDVLRAMNRHYTTQQFAQSVALIRKYFPLAGITTDVIVGFPTETNQNFAETLDFVQKVGFSQLHIFPYSKRSGTAAAKIYKDLPAQIKSARAKALGQVAQTLKANFIQKCGGGKMLVEGIVGKHAVGYTENYIKCFLEGNFAVGEIVDVKFVKPFKNGVLCEKK